MSYEYSENVMVRDGAGELLEKELHWVVAFAYNTEVLGENGTFGRKSYKEVLLVRYIRKALRKLNTWINDNQIDEAIKVLQKTVSTQSALEINEEKYELIKRGVPVTYKNNDGSVGKRRATLIDFRAPDNNVFLAIKELKVYGNTYHRRADIIGFVNGIPLLFLELKKSGVDVKAAYTDNYTDYQDTIPQLFYYNAFVMLSNGLDSRIGTLGSKYDFFGEWKRLKEEDEGDTLLDTMLRSVCQKENFLDLLENFILYDHSDGNLVKILARNHQFLGVNKAIDAYRRRRELEGRLGVFWHTQGSGKSYSMLFLAQKIRRKFTGSPTIVVLTDRDELNKQISGTFESCGLLNGLPAKACIASSGEDLIAKLKTNLSYVFTLIQKFNRPNEIPLYPDHDVVIFSDEAHRSQYGIFADNLDRLLPTANKIGFTGTPLFTDDNIMQRTFGTYVSIYDFKRAVDDRATVPLYYENRGVKIKGLNNPDITDEILDAIEHADLDEDEQESLEKNFSREAHILSSEPRLKLIARDFVRHYSDLWTTGKAMFICLNKVTCVKMYNYAKEYWAEEIEVLENRIKREKDQQEVLELNKKLKWMRETEMAVIISPEQNEEAIFKKWGLDIIPHRRKMMSNPDLDKAFKDSDNPFRIVFVCAMWLTGFDVKSLSCLYIDKPLKAHTLMQAIARANRVNEGKTNGLIIDYVGIVKALRKALADYTVNATINGTDPTIDKEQLLAKIREILSLCKSFLLEHGFKMDDLLQAQGLNKSRKLRDAVNAICAPDAVKRMFSTYASELIRLSRYADRDDLSYQEIREKNAISEIYDVLNTRPKSIERTDLMVEINRIVSEAVEMDNLDADSRVTFDISAIDFGLLAKEFSRAKNKALIFRDLEAVISERLNKMCAANPCRIDFYKRFQEIIEEYNKDQSRAEIEKLFQELVDLASRLSEEKARVVREGFSSEEELAIFDQIKSDKLSKEDIQKIKRLSIDLLRSVKEKIANMDHWTDKDETKSTVETTIRNMLYESLPETYDMEMFDTCREKVFDYVYTRYSEQAV